MSFKENRMGTSENSVLTTPVSNPTTVGINVTLVTEPRGIPLLYVQSPIGKKPGSTSTPSGMRLPPPLVPTSAKFPVNGVGGKLVQVQSPNQSPTFAYVGTLFRPGLRGQEPVTQKILLTPVKSKDGSITRFILPRPVVTPNTSQSPISVVLPQTHASSGTSAKHMSYVLKPVTSGAIRSDMLSSNSNSSSSSSSPLSSPSASASSSAAHKLFTPNIIRQKVSDNKMNIFHLVPKGITVMSPSSCTSAVTTESTSVKKSSTEETTIVAVSSESTTIVTTATMTTSTASTDCAKMTPTLTMTVNSNLQANLPIVSTAFSSSTSAKNCSLVEQIKCTEVVTIDDDEKDAPKEYLAISGLKERVRKRKGLLSNDMKKIVQPCTIELSNKVLPGAEEFDPVQIIEWDSCGLGKLPGSDINFIINDFGMLEVHEEKYSDKQSSDILEGLTKKVDRDPDEIYCCVACSCYGLISEFYDDQFCSKTCQELSMGKVMKKRDTAQIVQVENKKRRKLLQSCNSLDPLKVSNCIDEEKIKNENEKDPLSLEYETTDKKSPSLLIQVDKDAQPPGFTENVLKESTKNESECPQKFIKVKKIIKRGIKISRNMPPRTYSKLDDKSKHNLRSRNAEKCDDKIATEENEEFVQDSELVAVKPDGRKRNNSTENTPDKSNQPIHESFPWSTYLLETRSRPAWLKLFQNPFPSGTNIFKVGYKLEAIDPEHQAYICAVTVVQIKGFRLKLHFDGYSKIYDFWVNANSENIFPCGFCSQNGIPLQPPWGYNADTFSWSTYTASWKAKAAPPACFPNYRILHTSPNLFRVGMKLEAVDRKNSFLVCVATVAAVLGNRILVHFDSWGDVYDYWADTSSPYIHHVGWCKKTKHLLTPPNGIKPSEFSWEKYLKETNSVAAPYRAFRLRPHIDFKKGTKLEVVDKRAPHLLRVATIKDVLPYQIRVVFDGFPDHFGYWIDDDSPDLHPVGWGDKTLHPVEHPPTDDSGSVCPTPGCLGQGHAKGTKFESHNCEKDCPYSLKNLTEDELIPDRLSDKPCDIDSSHNDTRGDRVIEVDKSESDESEEDINTKRWKWLGVREEAQRLVEGNLPKKIKTERKLEKLNPQIVKEYRFPDNKSLLLNMPSKILQNEIAERVKELEPLDWDSNRVADFAKDILEKSSPCIIDEDIDGKAFLMMTQGDLVDQLGFKLGDAIKLFNAITLLRQKVT